MWLEKLARLLGAPDRQRSVAAEQRRRREALLAESQYAWSGASWDATMAERLKR